MALLKPLGDCVLVDPEPPPSYHAYKQYQHIVVPEKFEHGPEDRSVFGKILSMGSACHFPLKVGDRIVFGKWAGARIRHEEREIILVREDEILAIDG